MSGPSRSDQNKPGQSEPLEERIDMLFEELSFALQWQRPSILLVFYESKFVRGLAEFTLGKRLAENGKRLVHFSVDEKHFDIARLLSRRPDRDRSIYSVTGLSRGGGKEGANAYRALNMRREFFVDYAMRIVIWLAKDEATELSRHAPDFWAFRHRVVELNDSSDLEPFAPSIAQPTGSVQGFSEQPEELEEKIKSDEALLAGLPLQSEFRARRLDLLFELASLYRAKAAYGQSIQRLKQGIAIGQQSNDVKALAKFWGTLGFINLDSDQLNHAIRAYRKAIRLTPQDGVLWSGLGRTYLVQGRVEAARCVFKGAVKANPLDANAWINLGHLYRIGSRLPNAIIAYQKAIQLDPKNSLAHSSLLACYRLSGRDELAEKQTLFHDKNSPS